MEPHSGRAADELGSLGDALALKQPEWNIEGMTIKPGGFVYATGYAFSQSGDYGNSGITGQSRGHVEAQRVFDNGMELGARVDALLYYDDLSGDNYNNDFFERAYLFARTGFGRVEVGQNDGVGYSMGLAGPTVDEHIALENPDSTLFRDRVTGKAFGPFLKRLTVAAASSNFSKINYVSPRLFGLQFGASFTPNMVKAPLPGIENPEDIPDRQSDIWEAAVNYTTHLSDVTLEASAAYSHGSVENRTPGFSDLYDWALGTQIAYTVSNVKLSLGVAYRTTNAYLFDDARALSDNESHRAHLSVLAEAGSWRLGGEYAVGSAHGPTNFNFHAYEAGIGYKINDNMQISTGWQRYVYTRVPGIFANGSPELDMNAGFLSLSYAL
ncbi:MAG TPA: porin [Micropepsaceae bacterium]|nr:porin [Micropepsaceae bacterium]